MSPIGKADLWECPSNVCFRGDEADAHRVITADDGGGRHSDRALLPR